MKTPIDKPMAIFGGTFDPIHYGHLRTALELYQKLQLQTVRFIPCREPVLKTEKPTRVEHRLAMLQLALKQQSGFTIDTRELQRATPSYTVDTLTALRAELPNTPLYLIIGEDAFAELPRWYKWRELISLAHLVVVTRPQPSRGFDATLQQFIQQFQTDDGLLLAKQPAGYLYFFQQRPLDISATYIRSQIAQGLSPRFLLPEAVLDYILQQGLYRN